MTEHFMLSSPAYFDAREAGAEAGPEEKGLGVQNG